jgi:hypothetical protein
MGVNKLHLIIIRLIFNIQIFVINKLKLVINQLVID